MASTQSKDRAHVFTIGAAYGFVAGVFAMALIVWQFGSVVPTRSAARPLDAKMPAALDSDAPVVKTPAPAATSGSGRAEVAAPSIAPPPAGDLKDRDLEIPVDGV